MIKYDQITLAKRPQDTFGAFHLHNHHGYQKESSISEYMQISEIHMCSEIDDSLW